MSLEDREKWDTRYADSAIEENLEPDPFLPNILERLPTSGRALDLAGGSGRHAVALAKLGLDVTLVDISTRGLAQAEVRAQQNGCSITTVETDLDAASLPEGPFDLVWASWYLLSSSVWREAVRILRPGGLLAYVQPTLEHNERHRHPSKRFLLDIAELEEHIVTTGLTILHLETGWDENGSHTARLLARKPLETN